MLDVNIQQAKSDLSRLVNAIEQGTKREIVITRYGKPAARLVPLDAAPLGQSLGVAKGKFDVPDNIDTSDGEVASLFLGDATR